MAPPLQLSIEASSAFAQAAVHDGIVGCLFGSALGDAIGLYTEFLNASLSAQAYPSRSFALLPADQATPFRRDRHRDFHRPGEWTDDTDHAMLILLSFLHGNGVELDPRDFASRLAVWVRMGLRALDTLPFGLGRTVGAIVRSKDYLDDPEARAHKHWATGGYKIAPNGSLMRTHPLGLMCVGKTVDEAFDVAARFSVVTHADPRCVVSCVIGTALVRGLVRGEIRVEGDVDDMLERAVTWYTTRREGELLENNAERKDEPRLDEQELRTHATAKTLADLELDDPHKIGYVYKCLGSGILLLRLAMREMSSSPSPLRTQLAIFEQLITDLVMQGGDADTNACFAGSLLGSYLGLKALPPHWRDGLRHGTWLMDKAEGLCQTLGVMEGSYRGAEDKDTAPDGGRGFLTDQEMERKCMELQAWMAQRDTEEKEGAGKKKNNWFSWK